MERVPIWAWILIVVALLVLGGGLGYRRRR